MDNELIKIVANPNKKHKYYDQCVAEAKKANMYYTGDIDDKILFEYREAETDVEKKQRKRLYIARTRHVNSSIENILDSLPTLDTTALSVTHKNPKIQKRIESMMYESNVEKQAFAFIKHSTMTDANAFVVGGMDADGEVIFEYVPCKNVINYKIVNDEVKYMALWIQAADTKELDKVKIYTKEFVISGTVDKQGNFTETDRVAVKQCFAFHCGYRINPENEFKTYKTILHPSFNLQKQLVQDGSEYDVIKNCHGIERTFAFAPVCDYSKATDLGIQYCRDGNVYMGEKFIDQCPSCVGKGLKIHTSSQNMIYLPEPRDKSEFLGLDKLVHTVHIEQNLIQMIREDIKELENDILMTVFNSNTIAKGEINKTATEIKIDQNGIFAALTMLGSKVSDCVIWMGRVMAELVGVKDVSIYHGYTMEFNLGGVGQMIAARQAAVNANVSYDIVKVFDYGILKKQHMESPEFINHYSIWETFKPFADKSESERSTVLSSLAEDNRDRVLYYWYGKVQQMVLEANPEFYEKERKDQQAAIDQVVDEIILTIRASDQPDRPNMKNIGEYIEDPETKTVEDDIEDPN